MKTDLDIAIRHVLTRRSTDETVPMRMAEVLVEHILENLAPQKPQIAPQFSPPKRARKRVESGQNDPPEYPRMAGGVG